MLSPLRLKDKLFYGWVIVVACLIGGTALYGIRLSFGVFFKSLESEFNLTRVATSSVFAAYTILAAVFTIVGGWAVDRYGPRRVLFSMGLLTGLGLLITSQTNSFWQLFLSYSLLLAIGTGASYPVLMSVVSRWFDKKRGLALGIAGAGGSLGIITMVPFAAYLISELDWRTSYLVMGLVTWVVVISLSMLLRKGPSEIGVLPDGVKLSEGRTEPTGNGESQLAGFSLLQEFRTNNLWLIFAVWLLFSLSIHLVLTHIIPHVTDIGISTLEASTILSIMGGSTLLSRVLTGRVSDIIGRKMLGIIWAVLQSGALVGLIWAQDLPMFYLFAIAFGLSWGGIGVISTALIVDMFGGRNLGIIMGAIDVGFQVGAAIGPVVGGFVFDVTGTYTVAFAIGAAAMLVTALLIALTRREKNTEIN